MFYFFLYEISSNRTYFSFNKILLIYLVYGRNINFIFMQ